MNTSLKKGSSFTWQNIMSGVKSLRNGYIYEGLVMEKILIYGEMHGSLIVRIGESLHLEEGIF